MCDVNTGSDFVKIEKISENRIRCTLTRSDLSARHLSLGELAYGNDKARRLFREMVELAGEEIGFETDDMPLMVEAIPLSGDGVMLIITKVEDADELDTRFTKFTPDLQDEEEELQEDSTPEQQFSGSANDILNALNRLIEKDESGTADTTPAIGMTAVYRFPDIDSVRRASEILTGVYTGENSLFENSEDHQLYLTVHKTNHSPEEFNKFCNILTEFGERIQSNSATEAYFREHFRLILEGNALQRLA